MIFMTNSSQNFFSQIRTLNDEISKYNEKQIDNVEHDISPNPNQMNKFSEFFHKQNIENNNKNDIFSKIFNNEDIRNINKLITDNYHRHLKPINDLYFK